jgi:hypothetical protein
VGINKSRMVVAAAGVAILGIAAAANASARTAPETTASGPVPANSVTSSSVVNGSLWAQDLNPATVAWFTDRTPSANSVGSGSVVDGSLGQRDLYAPFVSWLRATDPNSVSEDKLSEAVRTKLNAPGPAGPQGEKGEEGEKGEKGEKGEQGIKGETGEKGADGVTELESDSPFPGRDRLEDNPGQGANSANLFAGDGGTDIQKAWVMCAEGKTAIGGGFQRGGATVANIKSIQIVSSSPGQIEYVDGYGYIETFRPIQGDPASSIKPNAWIVEGFNLSNTDVAVIPSVVCAKVAE